MAEKPTSEGTILGILRGFDLSKGLPSEAALARLREAMRERAPSVGTPLSEKVLLEILRSFIHAESLPSETALAELAVASGVPEREIKDRYAALHAEEGFDGDPWAIAP